MKWTLTVIVATVLAVAAIVLLGHRSSSTTVVSSSTTSTGSSVAEPSEPIVKVLGKDGAVAVVPSAAVEKAVEKAVLAKDHEKVDAHDCSVVEARVGAHIECQLRTATSDGWATGEISGFTRNDASALVVAW